MLPVHEIVLESLRGFRLDRKKAFPFPLDLFPDVEEQLVRVGDGLERRRRPDGPSQTGVGTRVTARTAAADAAVARGVGAAGRRLHVTSVGAVGRRWVLTWADLPFPRVQLLRRWRWWGGRFFDVAVPPAGAFPLASDAGSAGCTSCNNMTNATLN